MQTLWVGITAGEVLCHHAPAYNAIQQLREGRRFVAGPGLYLEAIRDSAGAVSGFGIIVSQIADDIVARDSDALDPYRQSARRVLRMRGIIAGEQPINAYIQKDILQTIRT